MPMIDKRKLLPLAVGILLCALAASNLLLIRQNLGLRREIEAANMRQGLRAGEKVEPFSASGLNEETINVSYTGSGPKRIFMFFSPSCRYSQQQAPYWREILNQADSGRFEVLGIIGESENRQEIEEYLRSVGHDSTSIPLRVAILPDRVRRAYKLGMTPTTVVVANDGTVENVWTGKWKAGDLLVATSILSVNFSRPD